MLRIHISPGEFGVGTVFANKQAPTVEGERKTETNEKNERRFQMSRKDTGMIQSFINWITGTGRTTHHTTTFWGCPRVEVTDYDKGYRSVRVRNQGFFGNKNSYRRESLDGSWQGEFMGARSLSRGEYSGDYEGICFRCKGTGSYKGHSCRRCHGTGHWHKHHGR